MNERIRPDRELHDAPGNGSGFFDLSPDTPAPVSVSSGPYAEQLPVGHRSIGEIRRLLGGRLDIDPQSQAVLDGHDVDDDVVVRPGQALMFTRRAGEKGTLLTIQGTEVTATSPEGQSASMPIEGFLDSVAARRMDTGGVVLPDGVKGAMSEGAVTIWIYERPPGLHRFRWIAPDSPVPFGPGTQYRSVRLALPYLIVFVVFAADARGQLQLTHVNECYFRVDPLKTFDDPLHFPALLNCSRFVPPHGRPLSWICTQHLKPTAAMRDADISRRLTGGFDALRHSLIETGFNYSSEHHEHSSWYSESRSVDPRISSVEAWEAASTENPLFALNVPWLPAGHTVRQVAARIFAHQQAHTRVPRTAIALARHVFNYQGRPPLVRTQPSDLAANTELVQP